MIKDKIALLMDETGCERGEAELALDLCGYDLESAVQAIPRLFQNIVVLKGRMLVRSESLYGLVLVILNLKERSLLRARAVLSYNPAVYSSELDRHWFDFEARLYACRLWAGTLQVLSQETEQLLATYFGSKDAAFFYEEGRPLQDRDFAPLRTVLSARLGEAELQVRPDLMDMGQFQEVRPSGHTSREEGKPRVPKRAAGSGVPGPGAGGLLILRVALEPSPEGLPAGELRAGDMVYATINDQRDIAQYLARLFGGRSEEGYHPLLVPVEAIEKIAGRGAVRGMGPALRSDAAQGGGQARPESSSGAARGGEMTIRVRFSAGVCGDVSVPGDIRLKTVRKASQPLSWWQKIFGA